jgi:pimeloyl-ACP methyl ester carboxylesterase
VPRPVVLVHGLATSSQRTWVETAWVDLLQDAGREVVLIDLPGHGGRPGFEDPDDYGRLDEVVAAELPDGTVDAVGFSAGARILLRLAASQPDRFDKLVLAGIGEGATRTDGQATLADAVEQTKGEEVADPIARHFAALAESSGSDIDAVLHILRRPGRSLSDVELANVSADVLVVLGDRDPAGPGEPLVARLPSAKLVMLPGVDHFATPKSMGFIDAGLVHLGCV